MAQTDELSLVEDSRLGGQDKAYQIAWSQYTRGQESTISLLLLNDSKAICLPGVCLRISDRETGAY